MMGKNNKGQSMMPMIIAVVAIVAIAGGAFYFLNMNSAPQDSTVVNDSMMEDDSTATDDAMMENKMDSDLAMMEDADVEVTVEGGMFYFEPNVIEAKVGETVTVTLESVEGLHDFVIDELNVATEQINAGNTTKVTFVVDEAGEFEFYCSVGNHRAQGMVGTLKVTE